VLRDKFTLEDACSVAQRHSESYFLDFLVKTGKVGNGLAERLVYFSLFET
jgi:hypothetical protein